MTIQELFKAVDVDNKDNPFETEQEAHLIDIVGELLPEIDEYIKAEDEPMSKLYDLIMYERERAFTVGYQTAISLIFAGVTVE